MRMVEISPASVDSENGLTWCGLPVDSLVQPVGCGIMFVKGREHTIYWAGSGMYEASFPDDDRCEWRRITKAPEDVTKYVLWFEYPPAHINVEQQNEN